MVKKSIFIFRRSYRLDDNKGLIKCCKESDKVYPVFIFTPEQITNANKYKSNNAIQFMIESLEDLNKQLEKRGSRLMTFYGENNKVLKKLIKELDIDAVYVNVDYTPYSRKRDKGIMDLCKEMEKEFVYDEDILLHKVGTIIKDDGSAYQKFTPFYRKGLTYKVDKPKKNKYKNFENKKLKWEVDKMKFYEENEEILVRGGRELGLKSLKNVKEQMEYKEMRNCLNYKTTQLSAYVKFGCISIREFYWTIEKIMGKDASLISQLYWRDFYYNIVYYYPRVIGHPMKKKYSRIRWNNNETLFKKWCEGRTGYPIVDAGMRQMNTTGYMHNRSRLIVSNFLIKLLLIDWMKGERYFATQLVDYDVSVNNGNWQWGSGSGADSQQYNRIFNPWLQSKKFDPNGEYIKKWVPELKDVPEKDLHKWDTVYKSYDVDYPTPIINYKDARKKTLEVYKEALFEG